MTVVATRRTGRRIAETANRNRSDWSAFGLYGVKYHDAMKAAADTRRELVRRIEEVDRYLATTEDEYRTVADGCQPAKEKLQEIREWFSGELEMACRALGLDSAGVGEKAAIYEYDAGYPRRHAEIKALREYLQAFGRYDGEVKIIVDSGEILDLARKFLDEMAFQKRTNCSISVLRYSREN